MRYVPIEMRQQAKLLKLERLLELASRQLLFGLGDGNLGLLEAAIRRRAEQLGARWVDPDRSWHLGTRGRASHVAFGMFLEGQLPRLVASI